MDIPEVAPLTASEARMIENDMQLTRHIESGELHPDDLDEIWERKIALEEAFRKSRTRTWAAWRLGREGFAA